MTAQPLTIWCNLRFPPDAAERLRRGVAENRLIFPANIKQSNLAIAEPDPLLEDADVAFGQPDAEQVINIQRLRWIHLTTAGYTRYDRADLKAALRARRAALTNSSAVFADPCAEHTLAMMMAVARQLPACLDEQRRERSWNTAPHRMNSRLLRGQNAVILGYGAIARRLIELLQPFQMNLTAVRRSPTGTESIKTIAIDAADDLLPLADHLVNILPDNESTRGFITAARLKRLKPGAVFYNIGRGTTVDQEALIAALNEGRLGAAYLDVTDPEPLPKDHPLWFSRNCFITPHTAGGHVDEMQRLVDHFVENLMRFQAGAELADRVV